MALARSLGVPLRHCTKDIAYCGRFYGQTAEGLSLPAHVTAGALAALVAQLQDPITELACHPGHVERLRTMYRAERQLEVEALCDPRVRAALGDAGVELTRFSELPAGSFDLVTTP